VQLGPLAAQVLAVSAYAGIAQQQAPAFLVELGAFVTVFHGVSSPVLVASI
jgi:hypothetical protein